MDRRFFSQLLAFGTGVFSAGLNRAAVASSGLNSEAISDGDQQQSAAAASLNRPVAVGDFIALAKATLPPASFDYITSGSEDEVTLRENVDAFRRIRLLPPLLHGVNATDLSTSVLGQKISMPVLLAPVAALRMFHPDGVLASARAAARAGTICAASSSALNSVEEIAQASDGPKWLQIYVPREREVTQKLVARAEAAGFCAIVVTVDLGERKDADLRNRFSVPKEMLLKHLRDIGYTQLTEQNSHEELSAFNAAAWDLSLNAGFFRWLRGVTQLPILLKGVLAPEAAQLAIDLGLNGIIVSNHGGRRLDGMPASIDVLRDVAEAVNGKMEILLDSGIRRGSDVLKALALGAQAVLIGRPQAWALAADGETGVSRVLEILREELTNAMIASGCRTIDDVNLSLLRRSDKDG